MNHFDWRLRGAPFSTGSSQHRIVNIRIDGEVVTAADESPLGNVADGKLQVPPGSAGVVDKRLHVRERTLRPVHEPAEVVKPKLDKHEIGRVSGGHFVHQTLGLGDLVAPNGEVMAIKVRRHVGGISPVRFRLEGRRGGSRLVLPCQQRKCQGLRHVRRAGSPVRADKLYRDFIVFEPLPYAVAPGIVGLIPVGYRVTDNHDLDGGGIGGTSIGTMNRPRV